MIRKVHLKILIMTFKGKDVIRNEIVINEKIINDKNTRRNLDKN